MTLNYLANLMTTYYRSTSVFHDLEIDMDESKKIELSFSEYGSKYIRQFSEEVRPLLDDAGVAVVIYHRARTRMEVHLLWNDQERHFSIREMGDNSEISEDPVFQSICDRVHYIPADKRSYRFEVTSNISGMLVLFAREHLGALREHIETNLASTVLRLENAVLLDVLQRNDLELELLQETGEILAMSLRLDDAFQSIAKALERLIPFQALAIFILNPKGASMEEIFSVGYPVGDTRELLRMKAGKGLVGWVVANGEPLLVSDVSKDSRYVAALPNTKSELVVPLFSGDEVIGAFNLESERLDAYTRSDLYMVAAFANQAALSVVRARLFAEAIEKHHIEDELEIARLIQKRFLPERSPEYPGLDMDGINISSQQVGGDYYDFIPIVDNQLGIAIADVSGKGIPAALIMASFRASLIAEIRNNYAIRTIMRKVNNLICESVKRGEFVTAVYGVLDIRNRVWTFSNGGHNPPFLLRANGKIEWLREGGLMLGVMPEKEYQERPVHLHSGDMLVLYTDGITEAENEDSEQFGTERLVKLVKEFRALPAKVMRKQIINEILSFKATDSQLDDLTLVLIKAE
jgi:sigma-B regulation protein RsbU (phosphoserine phosphatase)